MLKVVLNADFYRKCMLIFPNPIFARCLRGYLRMKISKYAFLGAFKSKKMWFKASGLGLMMSLCRKSLHASHRCSLSLKINSLESCIPLPPKVNMTSVLGMNQCLSTCFSHIIACLHFMPSLSAPNVPSALAPGCVGPGQTAAPKRGGSVMEDAPDDPESSCSLLANSRHDEPPPSCSLRFCPVICMAPAKPITHAWFKLKYHALTSWLMSLKYHGAV